MSIVIGLLFSCTSGTNTDTAENQTLNINNQKETYNLTWIEGNWKDTTVRGGRVTFCENWRKSSENIFEGEKYQIINGDTSSPTQLKLKKTDGKYYYSYFEEENQVTFVQDSLSNTYISFLNSTDKFPTNLAYTMKEEKLHITFSGTTSNGFFRKSGFTLTKQ